MVEVHGEVRSGWEPVREAFEANFRDHGDVGAAFALYVGGEKVADLWGGVADKRAGTPWEEDTMAVVFSTTKGIAAICAHLLAQQGALDLDAPASEHWPELARHGKGRVTTRDLLGHRAGLPTLSTPLTPEDLYAWDPVVRALEDEPPAWEPGTAHGYHALTYGNLVGEVVRRVTGRTIGTFLADEIAKPLGLDTFIGLPESEEPRVARLVNYAPPPRPASGEAPQLTPAQREVMKAMMDPTSVTQRALNVTTPPINWNRRETHAAEIPAGGGITTARSLAKLYAACVGTVDGIRVLQPDTVADAIREVSSGPDKVLLTPTRFGAGFFLTSAFSPLLGERSFGHAGAGGSLGFADPDAEVGFAYVMNQMQQNMAGDPRTLTLIDAVRRCLP